MVPGPGDGYTGPACKTLSKFKLACRPGRWRCGGDVQRVIAALDNTGKVFTVDECWSPGELI